MLRECTDSENRILKNCQENVLLSPDLYGFSNRKGALPILLGLFFGMGLGTLLVLVLPVNPLWIGPVWVVCMPLSLIAFDRGWQYLGCRRSSRVQLPGEHFSVNGGIILDDVSWGKGEAELTIAEDDLRDAMGRPVRTACPAPMNSAITIGQRILLVYCDNGAYIPLRLTEETQNMISPEPPAYFREVDWENTPKLPHPAALELDRKSYQMNEEEVKSFAEAHRNLTEIRVKNWIGIVLLGVLYLFLLGLLFIFLVAGEMIEEATAALLTAGLLLLVWAALTFFSARGILKGLTRGFGKLQYKKKVMFSMTYTESDINGAPMSYLNVYEYVGGELRQINYPIQGNVFLPKNIPYGRVIYKYSQDPEGTKRMYFTV